MRKGYLPALLFVLVFLGIVHCSAQAQNGGDTIPYKTNHYNVKKAGTSVSDLAQKLKVDAGLIVKLNGFPDEKAMIPAGTSVVVPVYTKEKNNKSSNAKSVAKSDAAIHPVDTPIIKQPEVAPINIELQKNRLLLIEATMDLNQTLLQGVQASIDSLNVPDKPIDDKNIQAKLHQMERQRDRILIKPYLAHIQDSLTTEISSEQKEQRIIQASLGIKQEPEVSNPVIAQNTTSSDVAGKKNNTIPPDTVVITTPVNKSEPVVAENKPNIKPVDNNDQANVAAIEIRKPVEIVTTPVQQSHPVVDVAPAQQPPGKKHWGTAKALPSLTETFFLQGMRDVTPISESSPATPTGDTLAYVSRFKPPVNYGAANDKATVALIDSINLLKSQLLVTRATAAINARNNALAEDYLQKAVDIYPNYYAAWYALADLHLQNAFPAKALNEFKICEHLDNSSATLYYKMGSAAFRSAQKDDAYNYFRRSLDIDSNYAPSVMGLGQTLSERKQYAPAIDQFGRVLSLNKGFHSAYKSRGIAEYMIGKFAAAIDDFTTYLLFEDKDGASYYYRGVAEIANKDKIDGCIDLSSAVRYNYYMAQSAINKDCGGLNDMDCISSCCYSFHPFHFIIYKMM